MSSDPDPRGNHLLATLPDSDYRQVRPHLEVVTLAMKEPLYEPGQEITHAHFPIDAVCSMLTIFSDGTEVEFATTGREGMVGLALFLGAGAMPSMAFAQIPGASARMTADAFRHEAGRIGSFDRVLRRYTQALFNQVSQTATCNRIHSIEERLARWLLMTHDRVGRDEFPLTHEFIASMLGVRRATVTVAAGIFQKAGLIRYSRGRITVTDRQGLEEASCECHGVIREEFERLIGAP